MLRGAARRGSKHERCVNGLRPCPGALRLYLAGGVAVDVDEVSGHHQDAGNPPGEADAETVLGGGRIPHRIVEA